MSAKVLLSVEALKKYYPLHGGLWPGRQRMYVHAVDNVSFTVNEGETLGVVGESGCGKSTLARCLLRLEEVTGGKIMFDGIEIESLTKKKLRARRREMQMIFQDPSESLNARHTVGSLLEEPFVIHKIGK